MKGSRSQPKQITPLTPCDQLALAQSQLNALLIGQSVRVVETPQLGRVEYATPSVAELQRLVAQLQRDCAAYQGITPNPYARGPVSFEVDP
jgi:hypothetical protein